MKTGQPFVGRIREIATEVARQQDVEFVHAEIAGIKRDSVVRIFIDKEGGVTLDDCSKFSLAVESVLDVEDLIPWAYVLEVSSPGIERELYSIADFVKFKGELVRVKVSKEFNGQKNFVGTIEGVDDDVITVDDRTSGIIKFPMDIVVKANLKMDLGKELKGR